MVNVAKASLKELLEDYEDYLKVHGHPQWVEGSAEYEAMRRIGREHSDAAYFMGLVQTRPPETIANMAIILLNQAADAVQALDCPRTSVRMAAFRSAWRPCAAKSAATEKPGIRTLKSLKSLKSLRTLKSLKSLPSTKKN